MEYIINARLRSQAYLKFMLFFVITILMIVAAVYFDVGIPAKDNKMLREKIRSYESEVYNQQQFITATRTAKSLVDSMKRLGQYNALLDREIARQLEIMKSPGYPDNSVYGIMSKDIFNVLYDYNELSKSFIDSKDAVQQVQKLTNDLNVCQSKLDNAQRSLDLYRKSGSLGL
jgi:hypothetical protein